MAAVRTFRELNVYKLARSAALEIFEISKSFPKEERYSLTDQIRRSSRATKAMLAEAWARRRYKAAFINKIDEALGEAMETQSWLDDAVDCEYITRAQFEKMDNEWRSVAAMLARMIDRAADFCKNLSDQDYRRSQIVETPHRQDGNHSSLITSHQSPSPVRSPARSRHRSEFARRSFSRRPVRIIPRPARRRRCFEFPSSECCSVYIPRRTTHSSPRAP